MKNDLSHKLVLILILAGVLLAFVSPSSASHHAAGHDGTDSAAAEVSGE